MIFSENLLIPMVRWPAYGFSAAGEPQNPSDLRFRGVSHGLNYENRGRALLALQMAHVQPV